MRPTRKMIAEAANVSEQTVSYVLNKSREFSPDVVKRVMTAVEKYNYKPDMIAKSMMKGHTMSVAILVNDIANPIFGEIFHGFQSRAAEEGYSVYLADAQHGVKTQVADLIARRIEGIYVALINASDISYIAQSFLSCGIKVVAGNRIETREGSGFLEVDMGDGMRKAVRYLAEAGHKKIAYLSGINIRSDEDVRYASFVESCRQVYGHEQICVANEAPYDTTAEAGAKLVSRLLAQHRDVTAVITTNDLMAYGAMEAVRAAGLDVPRDISVMGFDDILFSRYCSPALTTVGYDKNIYGKKIFDMLFGFIGEKQMENAEKIETYIVKRDSVRKLN